MRQELLTLILAFFEGFVLIISPCILPILPIILSGTVEGGKKRPIGIIIGFILTFALFTFFSKKLVQFFNLDLNLLRTVSFSLLLIFGIIMISNYLTDLFSRFTERLSSFGLTATESKRLDTGFFSGLIFGSLIGLIWTPCAGPILAAVIVQAVLQETTWFSFLTILSFAVGVALPMLGILTFGNTVVERSRFFKKHAIIIRKILGFIIIISVILMMNNIFFTLPSAIPNSEEIRNIDLKNLSNLSKNSQNSLINPLGSPYSAPQLDGISTWINSPALDLKELKGKVVLIDFWAYSCINCIRTLPYLKDWYKKYHDKGLVIIGVHAPEFDFEKDANNVRSFVQKNEIPYPIALDNQFATWRNYHNRYWPAHYLIDKNNQVVYEHFGEGEDAITEHNIRVLLGINDENQDKTSVTKTDNKTMGDSFSFLSQTPETYLGYARSNQFSSKESIDKDLIKNYHYPLILSEDSWALSGEWKISAEKITAMQKDAAIRIHFAAKNVFAVMGMQSNKPIKIKVLLNGEPVQYKTTNTIQKLNPEMKDGVMVIDNYQLYTLIELNQASTGLLEILAEEPGLEIYTFTFGN